MGEGSAEWQGGGVTGWDRRVRINTNRDADPVRRAQCVGTVPCIGLSSIARRDVGWVMTTSSGIGLNREP